VMNQYVLRGLVYNFGSPTKSEWSRSFERLHSINEAMIGDTDLRKSVYYIRLAFLDVHQCKIQKF
jgi:hypothetical protein